MKLLLCTIVLASLIAGIDADRSSAEVIELRTGQANGAPGACGDLDDGFHALEETESGQCAWPLSFQPFSGEFALAQNQPFAFVIIPFPGWITSLPCDPEARWINWDLFQCDGIKRSVLYACQFTITDQNASLAMVDACWAADDVLGDPLGGFGTANPIGVYLNGMSLDSSFSGGTFSLQSMAKTECVVPVHPGTNWLYAYQRDTGCIVSGLILSAKIDTCEPVSTDATSWGRMKSLYR